MMTLDLCNLGLHDISLVYMLEFECMIVVSNIKLGHSLRLLKLHFQTFTNLQLLHQNVLAIQVLLLDMGAGYLFYLENCWLVASTNLALLYQITTPCYFLFAYLLFKFLTWIEYCDHENQNMNLTVHPTSWRNLLLWFQCYVYRAWMSNTYVSLMVDLRLGGGTNGQLNLVRKSQKIPTKVKFVTKCLRNTGAEVSHKKAIECWSTLNQQL